MTDRELLELAAMACSLKCVKTPIGFYLEEDDRNWNPLTNDGDALRLAVKLNMGVQSNGDDHWQTPNCTVVLFGEQSRITQPHVAGALADTRSAINVERGCATYVLESTATEFSTRFLARIDAELGNGAVAWRFVDDEDGGHVSFQKSPPTKEQVEYLAKWNRPKWEPLFLSPTPTIPEGMALVPIEPTEEILDAMANTARAMPDDGDLTIQYNALIDAAQGERK